MRATKSRYRLELRGFTFGQGSLEICPFLALLLSVCFHVRETWSVDISTLRLGVEMSQSKKDQV